MRVNLKRVVDDSYEIQFLNDLHEAGLNIRSMYRRASIFIITDANVAKHHAGALARSLFKDGIPTFVLKVSAGEATKNRRSKERLEDQLISLGVARDSLIVALGGGMVGDLAGFVAATLHRGIPFVQIPTSLLAQVDSSVGGKVAVDHPQGKNLIGAFFQPKKVYIVASTLKTLSQDEFRNGMAEVIKYAAILDDRLFTFLERNTATILRRDRAVMRRMIARCCKLKGAVVEKDERETDYRRILNFGHTIGHAIEQVSNYRIAHGKAVAIGMVAEAKFSTELKLLTAKEFSRLVRVLEVFGLPTTVPVSMKTAALFDATLHDKKVQHGNVSYTLLEKIGKARIGISIDRKRAQELFER